MTNADYWILGLVCIVSVAGCSPQVKPHSPSTQAARATTAGTAGAHSSGTLPTSGSKPSAAPPSDQTTALANLLTVAYPEKDLIDNFSSMFSEARIKMSGFVIPLSMVQEQFPIQCYRRISDRYSYAVYKTQEGGLFFLFFTAIGTDVYFTHSYYAKQALDYAQFQSIAKGDTLTAVKQRDKAIRADDRVNAIVTDTSRKSFHLFPDRLVVYTYAVSKETDQATIVDIATNEQRQYVDGDTVFTYQIMDLDYAHLRG